MIILGLDLATLTGFCVGSGETLPLVGHIKLPKTGEEVGPYLSAFSAWLVTMLDQYGPDLVVFEAPIHGRTTTVSVTRKLHALPGLVEMICFQRGLAVAQANPSTVKKQLTGDGHADKARMTAFARAYGLTITVADEADAFAVWLVAIRARAPQATARLWDFIPFRGTA